MVDTKLCSIIVCLYISLTLSTLYCSPLSNVMTPSLTLFSSRNLRPNSFEPSTAVDAKSRIKCMVEVLKKDLEGSSSVEAEPCSDQINAADLSAAKQTNKAKRHSLV